MTRLLLFVALLLPVPASGQNFTTSDPNYRPVAGEHGPDSLATGYRSNQGIHTIEIEDVSDLPVTLDIRRARTCSGSCPERAGATLDVYIPDWALSRQTLRASVGANHFVTGIQICTSGQSNRTRRRIKGLRLWGARILPDGTVRRDGVVHEDTLPNCTVWYERQMCIGNRVAVGLRAFYDESRLKPWFTGIALQCARIQ